jgi:hypothetical protein
MITELIVAATLLGHTPLSVPNYEVNPSGHIVILETTGGLFKSFAAQFDDWQAQGKTLIIKSWCISACTMALSNPRACAMPKAYFGFHQARMYNWQTGELGEPAHEVNHLLWTRYPAKVRATVKELTAEVKYFKGTDLIPPC